MRTFTVGLNTKITGKCDPDQLSYSRAWSPAPLTLPQLADHIGKGHPWMPARLDKGQRRFQHYANHAELPALDIDGGLTIAQAMAHPFIAAHCGLGIESASSSPEHHKFRLVFALPHPVEGWQTIRICNRYLAEVIGTADPSCKDASRFFFGAPGRVPFLLNESATLPASFVEDAIAWHDAIEAQEKARAEQSRRAWEEYQRQHPGQDTDALLLGALNAISPDCDYNTWLAIGMALAGMGDQWVSVWDRWSAGGSSYKPGECDRKWQSFRGKRPAPEVVFGIAKKYGWRYPQKTSGDRPLRVTFIPPTANATSTKAAARAANLKRAAAILEGSLPQPHYVSEGQYLALPTLPDGFAGWAINAPMGAGKTTAIGSLVDANRAQREFTLELEPRNSLGQQAAIRHSLPHVHDMGTGQDANTALGAMARAQGGLVECPNSLPRTEQHLPSTGLHLVIDEAVATLDEALKGGTLKKRYSETIELLLSTIRKSKTIVLSESGLDLATVAFVEHICQKSLFYVRHLAQGQPWVATHHGSAAALFHGLYTALENGQRSWFATTSKTAAHEVAIYAEQHGIKYQIISGDTNEAGRFDDFFEAPDTWLEAQQLQLLISTQTVQTGLSVEGDWFDTVYGYGPGFAPDMLYQMIGRYRRPVPRFLWVPAFIQPQWWEKPQATNAMAELDREVSQWCGTGFNPSHKDPDQAAIDQFISARGEIQWALKIAPRQGLKFMLENGGHTFVADDSKLPNEIHEYVAATRAQCREALAQQRATDHATARIDPDIHTHQWFKEARGRETTYLERCLLFKASSLERFPGVDWDSPGVWYSAWFAPKEYDEGEVASGPVAPGAGLWAECEHLPHFEALDRDEVAVAMLARLRCAALLPTHSKKLAALGPLRPLCEQLLNRGVVKPGDPIVKRLATLARSMGEQLERYLRITATDDQGDVAIACKVLRKFGLSVARDTMTSRKGAQGARQWEYRLTCPPMWRALVDARAYALKALQDKGQEVATDLLNTPFNKSVASPPDGIPPDRWGELISLFRDGIKQGAAALADLKEYVLTAWDSQVWSALEVAA